jgi:hypothetical protein
MVDEEYGDKADQCCHHYTCYDVDTATPTVNVADGQLTAKNH